MNIQPRSFSRPIVLENTAFRLVLNERGEAESLIDKATSRELLAEKNRPFFTVTEARPHLNEVKLSRPNKRMTCRAVSLRQESESLIVGFEYAPYEAVIAVTVAERYITFTLTELRALVGEFNGLSTTPLPIEVGIIRLSVRSLSSFGEWLNVLFDEKTAVAVVAANPFARIDSDDRDDFRILTADAVKDVKLCGTSASLIVSEKAELLTAIDELEAAYGLPHGVKSRRADTINRSIYWSDDITPENVDYHIEKAKRGGFSMMLLYYKSFIDDRVFGQSYAYCGEYDRFRPEYPNGRADLRSVLSKIHAAGITPGMHILHSHIGIKTHYVTPIADPRLGCVRIFTLARPLSLVDDTVYVEQNPEGCYSENDCRVLRFGGEILHYESYTTEPPYRFVGCKRGHYDTIVTEHPRGEIGGQLDISEFGASSIYIDQNTDLQDEIADKLSELYACGFRFVYFDGSEGVNAPYDFHVANAQYRVYRKLSPEPIFCEGAARSHFGWHMLSGGNAFDTFPAEVFKEKIVEHPLEEAPRMQNDFTRLNFGWWGHWQPQDAPIQPDMYEFATSRAAAWDCPGTLITFPHMLENNPRIEDCLEVLRRWEYVRKEKLLTTAQKEALKDPATEHILIQNEKGEYELLPYEKIENAASGSDELSAFVFERNGERFVVCHHTTGSGILSFSLSSEQFDYRDAPYGQSIPFEFNEKTETARLPIAERRYIVTSHSKEELVRAIQTSHLR